MSDIWYFISDIVLPHIGTIILSVISFSFLGMLAATFLLIIMFRKKIMTRSNTAYKIIIRLLYIPLIIAGCIYCFGNWGFIRGVYEVVSAENEHLVEGIYGMTVDQYFGTDREKDLFLKEMKNTLLEVESSGLSYADSFEQRMKVSPATKSGTGITSTIVGLYRKEIYTAVLHGVFYAADSQFNTETDHESLDRTINMLYHIDREKIEDAVKLALKEKIQRVIDSHYHSALITNLVIWLVLMSIPFIEFLIYQQATKGSKTATTGREDPKLPVQP